MAKITYSNAILKAFEYLMKNDKNVFLIGQGLWSPWYVGDTMRDLDKKFGRDRVMDSPVSENAVTGIALGASLTKSRPIVIHPRMDFMILALDQIVNQAAKWRSMMGGNAYSNLTIRSIINRGGEQGAQHSQSLHSWLAHIPGIVVAMPYSVQDAHDLLISSVRSNNPVIFIDDRWLYNLESNFKKRGKIKNIFDYRPKKILNGKDITIVGCGFGTKVGYDVTKYLKSYKISSDLYDLRVLNPLKISVLKKSVKKTKRLVVIDPAWRNCSISSEVVAYLNDEGLSFNSLRINLNNSPAPTAKNLEKKYYFSKETVSQRILKKFF